MAMSKQQPMRPAEIELVDAMNTITDGVGQLQSDMEATNTVVGQLSSELGKAVDNLTAQDARITVLEDDFATVPVLEFGSRSGVEIPAGSYVNVNIAFTSEKQSTPHVLFSIERDTELETAPVGIFAIITGVGVDEFTVYVKNNDTTNSETVNIIWLAIGD